MKTIPLLIFAVSLWTGVHLLGELSDFQKEDALDTHNMYRNNLGWKDRNGVRLENYSVNMRKLEWHTGLEKSAQDAADQCVKNHLPMTGVLVDSLDMELGSIGENLYFGSGYSSTRDVSDYVKGWYSEVKFYDWEHADCQPRGQCAHLTQLIWASTKYVGCAQAKCVSAWASGNTVTWTNFVCRYGPAGNWGGPPFESVENYVPDLICTNGLSRDSIYANLCV